MFNGQGWLKNGVRARLTVIPVNNYRRNSWYDQTGLAFVKPSPNMPDLDTAAVYPGLCLLEATNGSEGRGTSEQDRPDNQDTVAHRIPPAMVWGTLAVGYASA